MLPEYKPFCPFATAGKPEGFMVRVVLNQTCADEAHPAAAEPCAPKFGFRLSTVESQSCKQSLENSRSSLVAWLVAD